MSRTGLFGEDSNNFEGVNNGKTNKNTRRETDSVSKGVNRQTQTKSD